MGSRTNGYDAKIRALGRRQPPDKCDGKKFRALGKTCRSCGSFIACSIGR